MKRKKMLNGFSVNFVITCTNPTLDYGDTSGISTGIENRWPISGGLREAMVPSIDSHAQNVDRCSKGTSPWKNMRLFMMKIGKPYNAASMPAPNSIFMPNLFIGISANVTPKNHNRSSNRSSTPRLRIALIKAKVMKDRDLASCSI